MAENEVTETTEIQDSQSTEQQTTQEAQETGKTVPLGELIEQRERRQAAEQANAELKQRLDAMEMEMRQAQQQQPQQQPQNFDVDAFNQRFWENPAAVLGEMQAASKVEQRIETSEIAMMNQVGAADYQEKMNHFMRMAQTDPNLIQQMRNHRMPAQFAYNQAKASMSGIDTSDYNSAYEKGKADALAELKKQQEAAAAAVEQNQDSQVQYPNSLANTPGSGVGNPADVPVGNIESAAAKKW